MKSIFDRATREEILGRIDLLGQASRPRWGKMTVGQMVRHCTICEEYYGGKVSIPRSFLGRLVGKMAIKSLLKNEEATLGKNAPTALRFKVTEEIYDLDAEKRKWKSLIEQYAFYENDYFDHWFFGRISYEQLGQFIYKHSDHHLKQFSC